MGRVGPGVQVLGLGMKMEQSLSPSAHLQQPVGAGAPVVGNSWRNLASGEPLELGGTGRTPWPQGCGGSLGFAGDQG